MPTTLLGVMFPAWIKLSQDQEIFPSEFSILRKNRKIANYCVHLILLRFDNNAVVNSPLIFGTIFVSIIYA
jgi:hypothetical protein